jgi:NADP-dependent 3-hydroxy acid dehydrogenase YdfG
VRVRSLMTYLDRSVNTTPLLRESLLDRRGDAPQPAGSKLFDSPRVREPGKAGGIAKSKTGSHIDPVGGAGFERDKRLRPHFGVPPALEKVPATLPVESMGKKRNREMKQTVLITGTSSGYGKATAELFLDRGWNVVATMRQPKPDIYGSESDRLKVLPLDVTNSDSISTAIAKAISIFGVIDVLVNNAGIGVVGAFEVTPIATVREVFETNTFGVMAMTQAVLPRFRERRSGVVVNVTSSVTLAPMPLAAAYTASKAAIEGFTGSLAFELEWFNVHVKLVEPG